MITDLRILADEIGIFFFRLLVIGFLIFVVPVTLGWLQQKFRRKPPTVSAPDADPQNRPWHGEIYVTDRTYRAGILHVSRWLREFDRVLPPGHRVRATKDLPDLEVVAWFIEGPMMPVVPADSEPERVTLLMTIERDGSVARRFGSWAHADKERWLIDETPDHGCLMSNLGCLTFDEGYAARSSRRSWLDSSGRKFIRLPDPLFREIGEPTCADPLITEKSRMSDDGT